MADKTPPSEKQQFEPSNNPTGKDLSESTSPPSELLKTKKYVITTSLRSQIVGKLWSEIPFQEKYIVSGMTRETVAYRLGLKNGDELKSINGKEINTDEDLKQATQSLSTLAFFFIEVHRRSKPMRLEYVIEE